MKYITCFFLLFFLIINLYAYSQADSSFLSIAVKKLENQPVAEKVYLHLDKPSYSFGDTIWYKAYTVIGQHHQLSALSKVLYIELISPQDSVINRQKIQLISGIGWGDIHLSPSLKQGKYRIRAYTNWMQNAGPDYFYDQRIRIGGMIPSVIKQTAQANPDVQFFPEGGQLVNGIRSRVAVKAVNTQGLGEDVKGTIEDNEGNVVAEFTTQHLGMGIFALNPQSGKTYKAKVIDTGKAVFTVDLPKAMDEGFTLALNNNQPDSIFIKVAVNQKLFESQKNSTFYIVAQSAGKVYYASQGKLLGLVFTAKADKGRFPSGIIQFTLFSQSGEPLAERIAFVQNPDTLKLNITVPSATFTTRQQVKIAFDAKDNDNKPALGSFSVAVINESQVAPDEQAEGTILNNLLLTSDLKGFIEQPNYYFINPNDQTKADLDVLMLTQGYRRFEWKQVLNNTNPSITYQPEKSLELSGTLKTPSGQPIPGGKITLVDTKENLLRDTTTDINGNFQFPDLYLSDTSNIILRARKAHNGSNVAIYVKQPEYPVVKKENSTGETKSLSPEAAAVLQKNYEEYQKQRRIDSIKNGINLKQVNVSATKINKAPELVHSDNLNGPGHADQVIMADKVDGCIILSDCLNGKVFGVTFNNGTPYSIRAQGRISGALPMVIIVDGNILDGSHLNDLNANDIYSIEVLRSGAYLAVYGSNAPGGALVITTKRGGDPNYSASVIPSGLITLPFKGYYKARSFYSPRYDHTKSNTSHDDFRTTIFWNPNFITDKDCKASFAYFNADTKGIYRVVIEGIDDNGNLGRMVYRYKVE